MGFGVMVRIWLVFVVCVCVCVCVCNVPSQVGLWTVWFGRAEQGRAEQSRVERQASYVREGREGREGKDKKQILMSLLSLLSLPLYRRSNVMGWIDWLLDWLIFLFKIHHLTQSIPFHAHIFFLWTRFLSSAPLSTKLFSNCDVEWSMLCSCACE